MATTFYPFVENDGCSDDSNIAQPSTSARIAVYDDMSMPPRVVLVEPADIATYLSNITQTVYELVSQKCDEWPFMVIRELVENYIHALFIEPSISILDKGRTIVFSDQGPGIVNKEASRGVGFSSATPAMKKYIRGVGSGFPIVENHMKTHNGTIRIEDNLGHGTIVTVSLGDPRDTQTQTPVPPQAAQQPGTPGFANAQAAYPAQGVPSAYEQPYNAYGAQVPPHPGYGSMQQGYAAPNPYGAPYPNQGYGQPAYGAAYQGVPQGYPQGQQWPAQPYPNGAPQYGAAFGAGAYPPPQAQPYGGAYGAPQPAEPWQAAGYAQGTTGQTNPASQGARGIDAHVPLTSEERDILKVFAVVEKVGPTELNKRMGIATATASRKLGELSKAGYITKYGQKYVLTGEGERVLSYLIHGEV